MIFARSYFFTLAARGSVVAKCSGDHAIWAASPSLSLFRVDLPRGENAKHGGEIRRPAALAAPRRLSVRRNGASGGRIGHSKLYREAPFWEGRLRYVPGDIRNPVATQTNGVAIIERRCCLSEPAFVISPPASNPLADERNIDEEIGRTATSTAAPSRCSPANVAEQAEQTDARTPSQRSRHY